MEKNATLCYVRVRCPCCGMWTRLDNLNKDQPLFEESTCYSKGNKGLFHVKKINLALRKFWHNHLKRILIRLGFEIPYEVEDESLYRFKRLINYGVEKVVSYKYE